MNDFVQTALVAVAVLAAAAFAGYRVWRLVRGKGGGCSCPDGETAPRAGGCSSCAGCPGCH